MTFEIAIYGLAAILLLAGITEEIILRRRGRKWKSKTLKK